MIINDELYQRGQGKSIKKRKKMNTTATKKKYETKTKGLNFFMSLVCIIRIKGDVIKVACT